MVSLNAKEQQRVMVLNRLERREVTAAEAAEELPLPIGPGPDFGTGFIAPLATAGGAAAAVEFFHTLPVVCDQVPLP